MGGLPLPIHLLTFGAQHCRCRQGGQQPASLELPSRLRLPHEPQPHASTPRQKQLAEPLGRRERGAGVGGGTCIDQCNSKSVSEGAMSEGAFEVFGTHNLLQHVLL